MDEQKQFPLSPARESFLKVVESIKKNSPVPLTEGEAHEAARNAINLCKTLLAIHHRLNQNRGHDKRD